MTKTEKRQLEKLLNEMRQLQTDLWDVTGRFEEVTGAEIDLTQYLEAATVDSLMEEG